MNDSTARTAAPAQAAATAPTSSEDTADDSERPPGGKRSETANQVVLRPPRSTDGAALHRLIADCPPLDPNSMYCNLLQCADFADAAVAAVRDGQLVGFVSGYVPPRRPHTLFVWQVAVHETARGLGLGKRMLQHLIDRLAPRGVRYMDTTITLDNEIGRASCRERVAISVVA